jgi:hypothetical protein
MPSLHTITVALLLTAGAAVPLPGQAIELHAGDRVRLRTTMSARAIEGTLQRLTPDTLVLVPLGAAALARPVVVPLASVQALDVRGGRRSEWRLGAEIGSFAGFVAASAIFANRMQRCVGWECGKSAEWLPYGAAGALAGAAAGSLVGLFVTHDRWVRAALTQVQPQVTLGGGQVGVRLSVRLPGAIVGDGPR